MVEMTAVWFYAFLSLAIVRGGGNASAVSSFRPQGEISELLLACCRRRFLPMVEMTAVWVCTFLNLAIVRGDGNASAASSFRPQGEIPK